jgi:hypothetical protein
MGRADQALAYTDSGEALFANGASSLPYGLEGGLGGSYMAIGEPHRWAELCRIQLERRDDNHVFIRGCRVFALAFAGLLDEARAAADGLIEAAMASGNPCMHAFAIAAYGYCLSSAGSERDLLLCRQGLALAQDTGSRYIEALLAMALARLESETRVTARAVDYVGLVIRRWHDAGNFGSLTGPLAMLSGFLARMGRLEAAATIAGYSYDAVSIASVPEVAATIGHLREALGDQGYESFARNGEAMSTAEIVAYAYDQIDLVRTELERSP